MKIWRVKTFIISKEIFLYSVITYFLLLFADNIIENFVSFYFNLNILLVIVLVSGIAMVLTDHQDFERLKEPHKFNSADVQNIFLISNGGALLVFFKTYELGPIAFVISGLTALIIALLTFLVLSDEGNPRK